MEKIQSAISKARAARREVGEESTSRTGSATARPEADGGVSGTETRPVRAPQRRGASNAADAAWTALEEMSPKPRHLKKNRIFAFDSGPGAREVDIIRTRLLQQCKQNGWRRIAITSPGPGCGKSTLAANLGFSLGRQRDHRTIVMELDLRRPSMARLLGLKDNLNVSRVLDGGEDFAHHARRVGPGLAFAINNDPVRHPAELLQAEHVAESLTRIEETYAPTIMVFDTPPLLVNDDAMAFMEQVDCALLVAAAEVTTIKEIDNCERMIASQTSVMGVVLNKCRYMPEEEKYGY